MQTETEKVQKEYTKTTAELTAVYTFSAQTVIVTTFQSVRAYFVHSP
jgi:hypothetical protein